MTRTRAKLSTPLSGRSRLRLTQSVEAFSLFAVLAAAEALIVLAGTSLVRDPLIAGSLVSVYAAAPFLIGIPAGSAIKYLGERLVIRLSLGLASSAGVIAGFFFSLPSLYIAQILLGAANVLFIIAALPSSARIQGKGAEDKAVGAFTFSTSLGRLLGPSLGGIVSQFWGFDVFYRVAGITSLAVLLLDFGVGAQDKGGSLLAAKGGLLPAIRNSSVRQATALSAMTVAVASFRNTIFPLYAQLVGLGPALIGPLFSLQSGAGTFIRPFLASLTRRYGRIHVLRGGAVLIGLGMASVPVASSFPSLAITSLVFGIGFGLAQPLSLVLLLSGTEGHLQHAAISVWLTSNRAVMLASPPMFTWLWTQIGAGGSFLAVAGSFLVTSMVFLSNLQIPDNLSSQ